MLFTKHVHVIYFMCTKGLRYAIEMSIIKLCAGLEGSGCLHILYTLLVNQQYVRTLVGKIEYMETSFF